MALLEVKDIKKNFGKTEVLRGVSFSLERGEVLCIIGSSAAGSIIGKKRPKASSHSHKRKRN